jgi:hypothetical protein
MCNAGFLAGLAQRNFLNPTLPVGMAAQLQPAAQLAMMRQQTPPPIVRHNPGRTGNVARPAAPLEAIAMRLDERTDLIYHVGLVRKRRAVAGQHVE